MFFHQDDIGVLIDLAKKSFWETIWISQGEHFSPLYNIVWAIQWRLFHLNFFPYVLFPLLVHFLNIILLVKIIKLLGGKKTVQMVAVLLFTASVTYTEPLLWFTVQGISLATFLVGLAFYFWLKNKFWWSILFSFLSGFAFGLGTGVGMVFAIITVIQNSKFKIQNYSSKFKIILYFISGVLSFLIGPVVVKGRLGTRMPVFDSLSDILLYAGFVLVGISRGIVGRLFLPGFEPVNEDVVGTVVSFVPTLVIVGLVIWIMIKTAYPKFFVLGLPLRAGPAASARKIWARTFDLLSLTSIFVIYPYIWAGFLRYQFGLKQALAERYAYPSLFFFVILVSLIVQYVLEYIKRGYEIKNQKSKIKNTSKKSKIIIPNYSFWIQKLFIGGALIIFIWQLVGFEKKARIFEERPMATKRYFEQIQTKLERGAHIKNKPLPKYINQDFYSTYDLIPIFKY